MATVVGVMDREGWRSRTDNIVVVDPPKRTLLWVPRDLWAEPFANRVNVAFARGGHEGLLRALASLGLGVRHSVVVGREAVERALAGQTVSVPVAEPLEYLYPLTPTTRIQDGEKIVRFDPPEEHLSGERIHQWLGARRQPGRTSSDLLRIERQKAFVDALLAGGFDFAQLLRDPELIKVSSDEALDELREVEPGWSHATHGPVATARIDGMEVLLRKPGRLRRLSRFLPGA